MKSLFVLLLAASLLLVFGSVYAGDGVAPAGNKVSAVKAGKEEGTIDKAFFKQLLAEKPSNVFLVDVRTLFEYKAGHFDGATHAYINDLYDKGCDVTLAQLPNEGYVVFVCATGARAGEMYFGIRDECKYKPLSMLIHGRHSSPPRLRLTSIPSV
jgi:hypothetical protein